MNKKKNILIKLTTFFVSKTSKLIKNEQRLNIQLKSVTFLLLKLEIFI